MRPAHCFLFTAAFCIGSNLPAQVGDRSEIDRSAPPSHWEIPDGKVRSPEESIALFELPPDFRVEVVAAEPLIQDPIAIQFDERGRIWALEWPTYNWKLRGVIPGLEKLAPPKSRVVILDDTDGDGRMDRRTVFMDDVEWPRGLQISRDGALIIKLPEIVFARDTDGDGKADQQEVLKQGLEIPANPHSAQNTLLQAMDNWMYTSKVPERFRLSSHGWNVQPNLSLRGQWGLSQDNYGRLVYASNGDHLRGDLVPAHYFTRNPNYAVTAGVDVRYPADQYVWPQGGTPGINRRAQLRDENGTLQSFTSNTGPCVYRGDQFPPEYVGNVFLGEVAGRFMRRSVLTEEDGLITARNAYDRREFLFSRDERFRPVYTTNGPDGALYVADMYRGIIEGDIFVTSFLRGQIVKRALQQPFHGMGRIYRIVHQGRPAGSRPQVAPGDTAGWVEHLAHANGFWRDTAQRLIVESGDRRLVPALREMALEHREELARLHALWSLDGLEAMSPSILERALRDPSAKIRIAALRMSERFIGDETFARKVTALADDERIEVRRQLMFSLGEGKTRAFESAMLELLRRDADKPIFVEAALSGLRDRELAVLDRMLADPRWQEERAGAARVLGALAQAVIDSGKDAALERLLQLVADRAEKPQWARVAILDGMKGAQRKSLAPLPVALAALEKSTDDSVRTRALALQKTWSAPPAAARAFRLPTGPVFDRGRELYAICAACHGPEGKGQPALAPPLEGSAVVGGPPEEIVRALLNGRNLDRANKAYPDMPPLGGLPDTDIAAVASYVRARWGGISRAITIGQVAAVRSSLSTVAREPAASDAEKR